MTSQKSIETTNKLLTWVDDTIRKLPYCVAIKLRCRQAAYEAVYGGSTKEEVMDAINLTINQ